MRPVLTALASVSLFSLLCVSGCAVGPSYRKPATTLEGFHSAGAVATRSTSAPAPALETWWDGFNDPMLSRVVQRARAQNLDLAAALGRVQQARAAAREAGAQLLPTIDLNGQATRIHQSLESPVGQVASHVPGFDRDQSIYDANLGASWELDLSTHDLCLLGINGLYADRRHSRRHGADAAVPSSALCDLVPGAQACGAIARRALLGYGTVIVMLVRRVSLHSQHHGK
jgi:outer membrane efflux protein